MAKKRILISEHIDAFRGEALLLLRYYIAWKRIAEFEDIKEISRTQWADQMISLKCIENDLVVRLSKFDDNDKRVHSFQRAIIEIPNSYSEKDTISAMVNNFQIQIKKIKQRRHEVLAHLKVGSEDNFVPTYDLLHLIKLVIDIIDSLAGCKLGYNWSDGKYEKYDLRNELFGSDSSVDQQPI